MHRKTCFLMLASITHSTRCHPLLAQYMVNTHRQQLGCITLTPHERGATAGSRSDCSLALRLTAAVDMREGKHPNAGGEGVGPLLLPPPLSFSPGHKMKPRCPPLHGAS